MSNNDERRSYTVDQVAAKVTAGLSMQMAVHLEMDTQISLENRRRIIAMFQPYWTGDVSFNTLLEALRVIGYEKDLDEDGLHQFINKGDLH